MLMPVLLFHSSVIKNAIHTSFPAFFAQFVEAGCSVMVLFWFLATAVAVAVVAGGGGGSAAAVVFLMSSANPECTSTVLIKDFHTA